MAGKSNYFLPENISECIFVHLYILCIFVHFQINLCTFPFFEMQQELITKESVPDPLYLVKTNPWQQHLAQLLYQACMPLYTYLV